MTRWNRAAATAKPRNLQTALEAFPWKTTPADALFVRDHGPEPRARKAWRITIAGSTKAVDVDARGLERGSKAVRMVLECAGNGRSGLSPRPPGVAWGEDAVGCVRFRGAPLAPLLREAGVEGAVEVLFAGADDDGSVPFERSLPIAKALDPGTMLAWSMNGRRLTREHGGPLRLVVPGWYGVASVKWLRSVECLSEPFEGKHQTEGYVYRGQSDGTPDGPVGQLRVKSRIVAPAAGASMRRATTTVWGWAWSGDAPVRRVEVSVDGGRTWARARVEPRKGHAWQRWTFAWRPTVPGPARLAARAMDASGAAQPLEPVWNELGYGNNAVVPVDVVVR